MRPNGRTIYKVLMKGRATVFWGRRAYITVRLPTSVFPVPRPSVNYCKDWGEQIFSGTWSTRVSPEVMEYRDICRSSSYTPPESAKTGIHFLEVNDSYYSWWEGTLTRVHGTKGASDWLVETLPESVIAQHRAVDDWDERYLTGNTEAERGPVLDAFLTAANWAKTHYTALTPEFLYITYSVKWFYHNRAHRFCGDLKRAFRVATAYGVDARLIRRGT